MERSEVIVCRLQGAVDVRVLDALARLRLAARRQGLQVELQVSGQDLTALLVLTGFTEVLQPAGQSEAWEERCGVEEVVEVDEPSA